MMLLFLQCLCRWKWLSSIFLQSIFFSVTFTWDDTEGFKKWTKILYIHNSIWTNSSQASWKVHHWCTNSCFSAFWFLHHFPNTMCWEHSVNVPVFIWRHFHLMSQRVKTRDDAELRQSFYINNNNLWSMEVPENRDEDMKNVWKQKYQNCEIQMLV